MNKSLLAIFALAAVTAAPATAADLPAGPAYTPPPQLTVAYRWGGFYVGIHGGGDWFDKDWFAPNTATNIVVGCGAAAPLCDVSAGSHASKGWLAGGQIGFNHQVDWFVWGVEVQGSWTNLEGSSPSTTPGGVAAGLVNHSSTISLGTAAVRVGAAWWDRTLFYVKGGGAWAFDKFWTTAPACNPLSCQTLKDTRWGWMVGVGIEFAFARNWSVKVEYDHLDFSRQRETLEAACGACLAFEYDIRQRIDLIKVGLNYSFNSSPVVARY